MTDRPPKKHPPVGRQAFAVLQDDIKAALDRGEWMSTIYEERKAKLPFSYPQFTRHCRRVFGAAKNEASDPTPVSLAAPPPPPALPTPRIAAAEPPPPTPPRQAQDDRPKRFKMKPKTDDQLF